MSQEDVHAVGRYDQAHRDSLGVGLHLLPADIASVAAQEPPAVPRRKRCRWRPT